MLQHKEYANDTRVSGNTDMKFTSKEQTDAYYNGDRIQCLICGKWYKSLGKHVYTKHKITAKNYKIKFGLPRSRGLCSCKTFDKHSVHAVRLISDGIIDPWEQLKRAKGLREASSLRGIKRPKYVGAIVSKIMTKWTKRDYDRVLKRMAEEKRVLKDVCSDKELPSEGAWYKWCIKHPEYLIKTIKITHSFPYNIQTKSGYPLPQKFHKECKELYENGFNFTSIARKFGVERKAIRRSLKRTGTIPKQEGI